MSQPTSVKADRHLIAGRMSGASGVATFCTCGLAFFATYDAAEAGMGTALELADLRWSQHVQEAGE